MSLPVAVIKDNNIGARQVNAKPTGASGKQEDKLVAPLFVIIIDGLNTVLVCGAPIDPTILWYIMRQLASDGELWNILYALNKQ